MDVADAVIASLIRKRWRERRIRAKCTCDSILPAACRYGRALSTNPDCPCECHVDNLRGTRP